MISVPWRTVAIALVMLTGLLEPKATLGSEEPRPVVRIGSKAFTESHILAELAAQLLEHHGYLVERKLGLGGTLIAYQALSEGAIDLYPEYTGTLTQVILQQPELAESQLANTLSQQGLQLLAKFGFNNSYAIAISSKLAKSKDIKTLSELAEHPQLRLGFSLEFLNREDGWPALKTHYRLPHRVTGIEHALAYGAIEAGQLDATDAYSTDGQLNAFSLRLLEDDRQFFPNYNAALLTRDEFPEHAANLLMRFTGLIDAQTMRNLNARVSNEGVSPAQVAADFLATRQLTDISNRTATSMTQRVLHNSLVHLKLTSIALLLALLVAIPLALSVLRRPRIARGLLYITGLIQTIPSLALLALLIPLLGLGQTPAILALFLYSLLPIIRNTLTGIYSVDPLLKQVATGMGLTPRQQLLKIELPLASPTILAGIKTAAIISIGTATLAAFVGAGGLGEPIITGLTLNNHWLILEGAIPAALLAVITELTFECLERFMNPKHLQQSVLLVK